MYRESVFLAAILSSMFYEIWPFNCYTGYRNEIVCFAKIKKPLRQHFGFFDVISSQVLESSKFKIISWLQVYL